MAQAGQAASFKETPTEGIDPKHPCTGVTHIVDARNGHIRLFMPDGITPRKKIAICGFASSSRDAAPWQDPDWAILGMNQLNRHVPRADIWYEIHKEWNEAVVPGTDHEGWLKSCGIPVFMTDDRAEALFPTWVRYPIEALLRKFPDYWTSTVAYMLGWAIDYIDREVEAVLQQNISLEGLTALDVHKLTRALYADWTIGIWGVDLVVGEEYGWQKPCAEYYIGEALGRNITVRIPPQSALLHQRYRYGYQMEPTDSIKDSEIEARRVALANKHTERIAELHQLEGAVNELRYMQEARVLRERGTTIKY